jgi:hypothetical protein
MTINRRTALRQLVFLSVGAALLPSCLHNSSKAAILLKNFTVDNDQEKLLGEFGATLIPTTSTPGAREVAAHLFVLRMLDDCYSKEDQSKFMKGLEAFKKTAHTESGDSFVDSSKQQREAVLGGFESGKLGNEDAHFFYSTAKQLTIQAYTTAPFYLTKVQVYELVPGRWHGCVPVKTPLRAAS